MNKNRDVFLETMKLKDGTPLVTVDTFDWLIANGFFEKPAAIKHHGNYTGGLFEHSLEVTNTLVAITERMDIKWENPRSPYIVGMFHDLCKIDDYVDEKDTVMIGTDAAIPNQSSWTYNPNKILKGHGDKSVMMLSQLMTLTEEEIMCIRFHMGSYETDAWNQYDATIKKYETVLWTHTADMYASKVKGI